MRRGVSLRLVILIDSNIVRCAASKGGSSSKALSPALFRLAAFCIIGGRYLVFRFCPYLAIPFRWSYKGCGFEGPNSWLGLSRLGPQGPLSSSCVSFFTVLGLVLDPDFPSYVGSICPPSHWPFHVASVLPPLSVLRFLFGFRRHLGFSRWRSSLPC